MLHNIAQKYIAEKSDILFWKFHQFAQSSQKKVEAYVKEHKSRVAVLQKSPRTGCEPQTHEVLGMFLSYDAGKGLNNQEIKTVDMMLEFKPEHEKR